MQVSGRGAAGSRGPGHDPPIPKGDHEFGSCVFLLSETFSESQTVQNFCRKAQSLVVEAVYKYCIAGARDRSPQHGQLQFPWWSGCLNPSVLARPQRDVVRAIELSKLAVRVIEAASPHKLCARVRQDAALQRILQSGRKRTVRAGTVVFGSRYVDGFVLFSRVWQMVRTASGGNGDREMDCPCGCGSSVKVCWGKCSDEEVTQLLSAACLNDVAVQKETAQNPALADGPALNEGVSGGDQLPRPTVRFPSLSELSAHGLFQMLNVNLRTVFFKVWKSTLYRLFGELKQMPRFRMKLAPAYIFGPVAGSIQMPSAEDDQPPMGFVKLGGESVAKEKEASDVPARLVDRLPDYQRVPLFPAVRNAVSTAAPDSVNASERKMSHDIDLGSTLFKPSLSWFRRFHEYVHGLEQRLDQEKQYVGRLRKYGCCDDGMPMDLGSFDNSREAEVGAVVKGLVRIRSSIDRRRSELRAYLRANLRSFLGFFQGLNVCISGVGRESLVGAIVPLLTAMGGRVDAALRRVSSARADDQGAGTNFLLCSRAGSDKHRLAESYGLPVFPVSSLFEWFCEGCSDPMAGSGADADRQPPLVIGHASVMLQMTRLLRVAEVGQWRGNDVYAAAWSGVALRSAKLYARVVASRCSALAGLAIHYVHVEVPSLESDDSDVDRPGNTERIRACMELVERTVLAAGGKIIDKLSGDSRAEEITVFGCDMFFSPIAGTSGMSFTYVSPDELQAFQRVVDQHSTALRCRTNRWKVASVEWVFQMIRSRGAANFVDFPVYSQAVLVAERGKSETKVGPRSVTPQLEGSLSQNAADPILQDELSSGVKSRGRMVLVGSKYARKKKKTLSFRSSQSSQVSRRAPDVRKSTSQGTSGPFVMLGGNKNASRSRSRPPLPSRGRSQSKSVMERKGPSVSRQRVLRMPPLVLLGRQTFECFTDEVISGGVESMLWACRLAARHWNEHLHAVELLDVFAQQGFDAAQLKRKSQLPDDSDPYLNGYSVSPLCAVFLEVSGISHLVTHSVGALGRVLVACGVLAKSTGEPSGSDVDVTDSLPVWLQRLMTMVQVWPANIMLRMLTPASNLQSDGDRTSSDLGSSSAERGFPCLDEQCLQTLWREEMGREGVNRVVSKLSGRRRMKMKAMPIEEAQRQVENARVRWQLSVDYHPSQSDGRLSRSHGSNFSQDRSTPLVAEPVEDDSDRGTPLAMGGMQCLHLSQPAGSEAPMSREASSSPANLAGMPFSFASLSVDLPGVDESTRDQQQVSAEGMQSPLGGSVGVSSMRSSGLATRLLAGNPPARVRPSPTAAKDMTSLLSPDTVVDASVSRRGNTLASSNGGYGVPSTPVPVADNLSFMPVQGPVASLSMKSPDAVDDVNPGALLNETPSARVSPAVASRPPMRRTLSARLAAMSESLAGQSSGDQLGVSSLLEGTVSSAAAPAPLPLSSTTKKPKPVRLPPKAPVSDNVESRSVLPPFAAVPSSPDKASDELHGVTHMFSVVYSPSKDKQGRGVSSLAAKFDYDSQMERRVRSDLREQVSVRVVTSAGADGDDAPEAAALNDPANVGMGDQDAPSGDVAEQAAGSDVDFDFPQEDEPVGPARHSKRLRGDSGVQSAVRVKRRKVRGVQKDRSSTRRSADVKTTPTALHDAMPKSNRGGAKSANASNNAGDRKQKPRNLRMKRLTARRSSRRDAKASAVAQFRELTDIFAKKS